MATEAPTIHICWEPQEETYRRPDGTRWCFTCRSRQPFDYVVMSPVEDRDDPDTWSYYGPTPHIECATCHTHDGDVFPGCSREWSDD